MLSTQLRATCFGSRLQPIPVLSYRGFLVVAFRRKSVMLGLLKPSQNGWRSIGNQGTGLEERMPNYAFKPTAGLALRSDRGLARRGGLMRR